METRCIEFENGDFIHTTIDVAEGATCSVFGCSEKTGVKDIVQRSSICGINRVTINIRCEDHQRLPGDPWIGWF